MKKEVRKERILLLLLVLISSSVVSIGVASMTNSSHANTDEFTQKCGIGCVLAYLNCPGLDTKAVALSIDNVTQLDLNQQISCPSCVRYSPLGYKIGCLQIDSCVKNLPLGPRTSYQPFDSKYSICSGNYVTDRPDDIGAKCGYEWTAGCSIYGIREKLGTVVPVYIDPAIYLEFMKGRERLRIIAEPTNKENISSIIRSVSSSNIKVIENDLYILAEVNQEGLVELAKNRGVYGIYLSEERGFFDKLLRFKREIMIILEVLLFLLIFGYFISKIDKKRLIRFFTSKKLKNKINNANNKKEVIPKLELLFLILALLFLIYTCLTVKLDYFTVIVQDRQNQSACSHTWWTYGEVSYIRAIDEDWGSSATQRGSTCSYILENFTKPSNIRVAKFHAAVKFVDNTPGLTFYAWDYTSKQWGILRHYPNGTEEKGGYKNGTFDIPAESLKGGVVQIKTEICGYENSEYFEGEMWWYKSKGKLFMVLLASLLFFWVLRSFLLKTDRQKVKRIIKQRLIQTEFKNKIKRLIKNLCIITLVMIFLFIFLPSMTQIKNDLNKCTQDSNCSIKKECINKLCIKINVNMSLKENFNYSSCLETEKERFSCEHQGLILDFNQAMTPRKVEKFLNSTKINLLGYEHSYSGSYLIGLNSSKEVEDACKLASYDIVSNIWPNCILHIIDGWYGSACMNARLGINQDSSCYNNLKKEVKITISRGAEDFVPVGIQVVVSGNGTSKSFKIKDTLTNPLIKMDASSKYNTTLELPNVNEARAYRIKTELQKVTEVAVAPIVKIGNTEKTCDVSARLSDIRPC